MLVKKGLSILVLLVVFLPAALPAQEMMHGKWWHKKSIIKEMGLSDDERRVLDEIYTESRRRMIDLKSEVEKQRFELDLLLGADDFDRNKAMNRYRELEQARMKLSQERFDMLLGIRETIGPERYMELKQMHRDRYRRDKKRYFKDKYLKD